MRLGLAVLAACSGDARRSQSDPTLVVVIPTEPDVLDPRFPSDAYGLKVSRLIFGSLVTIDPRTLDVVPDLAERVDVVSPTEYVAHLRAGLTYQDGSTLDADDVLATFRAIRDPARASGLARAMAHLTRIERVDALTVRFVLDGPQATFMTDLEVPIVRVQDERRSIGTAEGAAWPVGAGPYRLARRTTGRLSFVPFEHWHRGAPRHPVELVVLRDDNTRALRLLAGGADLALNTIPPLLAPLFAGNPEFRVASVPGPGVTYLAFEMERPPLGDLRVRRAIAHAIDRESLVRGKFGARARLAVGWIPPGHWAYAADTPSYAYDPARARRLLDEAGVRDPDGDGPEPRLRLAIRTSTDRFRQSIVRAIARMLRDVGIEAQVRPSEMATLLEDLRAGRFELATLQFPEMFEPHALSLFFASDAIPRAGRPGQNRFRYRNAEADALFEQGRTTLDRPSRRRIYQRIQHVLARDLPCVPLWHEDVVAVVRRARMAGYAVPRDARFGTLATLR